MRSRCTVIHFVSSSAKFGLCTVAGLNGAFVEKGEVLAVVTDPYGNYEKKIKSSGPGYVICVNKSPVVYKGDAILHVARAAF